MHLDCQSHMDLRDRQVEVITGLANPARDEIHRRYGHHPAFRLLDFADNMADKMARADLFIGGAGTTTWERCCLGLPSLIIALAENQVAIAEQAARRGIARYLGPSRAVDLIDIREHLQDLLSRPETLADMSRQAWALVDGEGTGRVVQAMHDLQPGPSAG